MTRALPKSVDETVEILAAGNYIADRNLATTLHISLSMQRPIFHEGEAGVGKTELAKVVAEQFGRKLLRLQCYEGLDVSSAVYEWNYARQMIEIRLSEALGDRDRDALAEDIFSERFLITRPLLRALEPTAEGAPVLLIDELDRADEPFEAFLLEVLADYQITIPEIGTVKAAEPPLKRRCLYHWIDYPDAEREQAILTTRLPDADKDLSRQVVAFVQELRKVDLFKLPGVAESIDWLESLTVLGEAALNEDIVRRTLGVLLKYQDDIEKIEGDELRRLLDAAD